MLQRPANSAIIGETLADTLRGSAVRGHGRLVFHLDSGPVELGWDELLARAEALALALQERGVGVGDRIGVLGRNRPEWAVVAYATWLLRAALVPLPVPLRVRDGDSFARQVSAFVEAAGCRFVLASPEYGQVAGALRAELALPWSLAASGRLASASSAPDDLAVIQFTSGSTAAPSGVMLTQRAVVAQLDAIDGVRPIPPSEYRALTWAPFFHDMGLFLCLAAPVAQGTTMHILPTELFARNPSHWFTLISELGIQFTIGPCSAWQTAARLAERRRPDLSSMRVALFGAESVDPTVVDEVLERLTPCGLDPAALGSTYGLAEAVLGITCSRPDRGLRFDTVDPAALASGEAVTAEEGRRIASAGHPVVGTEVRIAREGETLSERVVGEIQARGASIMSGYAGAAREQPFVDGWLRTGDLGYMADGELFVTGRIKDVIVSLGHNYFPTDVEWAAGRLEGVRRCVAFGVGADGAHEARLVVLVEGRAEDAGDLALQVKQEVLRSVGIAPDEVLWVPRGTIQLTTSGKLRRKAMRDAYESGELLVAGGAHGG